MTKRSCIVALLALTSGCMEMGEGEPVESIGERQNEITYAGNVGSATSNSLTTNSLTTNSLTTNSLTTNSLTTNSLTTNSLTTNGVVNKALSDPRAVEFLTYAVECALPEGQSVTITDSGNVPHTFYGSIGLAPEWKTSSCGTACQEWVTACLIARTNGYGVRKVISMRKPTTVGNNAYNASLNTISADEAAKFPTVEGAYYGNLFTTAVDASGNRYSTGKMYACSGQPDILAPGSFFTSRFCTATTCPTTITIMGQCKNTYSTDGAAQSCYGQDSANGAYTSCANGDWYDNAPVVTKSYTRVLTVYRQGLQPLHSDFVAGAKLEAGGSPCAFEVGLNDPYCYQNQWDELCRTEARDMCGEHPVTVTGSKLHLGDSSCIDRVCAGKDYARNATLSSTFDSYCCNTSWDSLCVNEARSWCNYPQ